MKNFENYYGIKCIRNKNLPHREKGYEIETLYEDLREEEVIKKYYIPEKVVNEILTGLPADGFTDFILRTVLRNTIETLCKRFCGDRGVVIIDSNPGDHYLFSIQEDYVQLSIFQNEDEFSNTKNTRILNHVSDITIDVDELDNTNAKINVRKLLENVVFDIGDNTFSFNEFYDEFYNEKNIKTIKTLKGMYGFENDTDEGAICKFQRAAVRGFLGDLDYFLKLKINLGNGLVDTEAFGIRTIGNYSFKTMLSLISLLYIKLMDYESHFESILPKTVKNRPTTFIDSKTGKINNGVIIVDKFYNTEIFVDHPFGVCGHWRNQYCGRDEFGNKKHKRIWIEAFEKSGYHRKSTKMKLEEELNKSK